MSKPRFQFPGLTSEDMAVLNALPDKAARIFENSIKRDARRERSFRQHVILEASTGTNLETLVEPELARWGRGAGGGRRRRPDGAGPDG